MYSLYRAWFGSEGCSPLETRSMGPVSPAVGLSPPDTLIRVGNDGEHQFVAHRSILAAHSGYLKALLATASNVASSSSTISSSVASLSVSSVGGEAFAPLLNYMYTGRLEVTLDNIYSVLLATHLLHMPGALEQCRAALLKLRAPPATSTGVLRPVPSRVVGPPLCWPPPTLYSTGPLPLPNLGVPASCSLSRMPGTPISHESHPIDSTYNVIEKYPSPRPSTSQQRPRSPARSSSPEASGKSEAKTSRLQRSPSPADSSEQISVTDSEPNRSRKIQRPTSTEQGNGSNVPNSSVVIDIACCDGPVRFHRVLNENYSASNSGEQSRVCEIETTSENDENICDVEGEVNLESPGFAVLSAGNSPNESGHYTCGYCRHTFKSQYCYQKHARRHLHPANGDGQTSAGRRREVRLLDLNVQYYPCKICGSKFPSYYFVHKHRKLCHANEDNQSGSDEPNINNSTNAAQTQ
ncbi:B-cell CLL/lymphoma 6 member B protein [Athalia rosae]|uniref:B-cell CLL/lymphoma 6 member B protein n=1 Tax=Athalia rosae TaxID=37344 RepID=UPI0020339DC4|nr:B-cell CLL/lymphoma 6 member B protein [Athalia rosae]